MNADLDWISIGDDIEQAVAIYENTPLGLFLDMPWQAVIYTRGYSVQTIGQYFKTKEEAQAYVDKFLDGIEVKSL